MLPLCTLAESIAEGIAFTDGKRFDVAGKIDTKARSGRPGGAGSEAALKVETSLKIKSKKDAAMQACLQRGEQCIV